jgi:16S rRNA G966 N2-methylase RsmD
MTKPIRPLGTLADKHFVSPFSVLSSRDGWWQERKRTWLARGLDGPTGRKSQLIFEPSCQPPASYKAKTAMELELGRSLDWPEFARLQPGAVKMQGTSLFDPVLAEIVYRWFSPPGGLVLDPFAGGAVRGIVAGALGRRYVGIDLRPEQIKANQRVLRSIKGRLMHRPDWHIGDARFIGQHIGRVQADLVFTCPPYGDLERYSKRAGDLSNMTYPAFLDGLKAALEGAARRLRDDRFLCLVVGDFRDRKGHYRGFIADCIGIGRALGLAFYNDAVLVTTAGSLPVRADKMFRPTRKLGKTHQNLLVFLKGDARRAAEAIGPVDVREVL